MGTIKKEHIKEINIFRAISILAVIMIHATSESIGKINKQSLYYPIYNGLNIFSSFAVPTFIFLSGLVMFYTYYDRALTRETLLRFYKKRLLYIFLPYVTISTLYYAIKLSLNTADLTFAVGLKQYAYQLLTGSTYAHLYFMLLIIQFYLVFPFLLVLAKCKGMSRFMFIIGVILQWGYIFLNSEVIQYMTDIPEILHKRASLFPTYLAYYLLGATIGIYYSQFKKWFLEGQTSLTKTKTYITYLSYALWLASGLYYSYIYYMGRANNNWSHSKVYDLLLFSFTIFSCIVLLHLSYWIIVEGGRMLVGLLTHLGLASFGVYFFHPAILLYYRKAVVAFDLQLKHPFYYGGAFLIALIVSWAMTALLMKFPEWSWIIIGR
jgi:peptidoglycan/LPS O-acetylase OafA/YrhL